MKITKIGLFKILLITILLFLPLFSFAVLDLEYNYPAPPGTEQTIGIDTPLGGVIKYFVSWAIIIGAIIAFGSLIYAGIMYLTSTGNPAIMQTARGRILNSFLGLVILLGSYLILITINPQLVVVTVEREPVFSGTVLLDSTGAEALKALLKNNSSEEVISATLEDLIASKNAYPLRYNISNLQEEELGEKDAGRFVATHWDNNRNVTQVNFENFNFRAIAFSGDSLYGKTKVILFAKKDFEGSLYNEYTSEGLIDVLDGSVKGAENVNKIGGATQGVIHMIDFIENPFFSLFSSKVEYYDYDPDKKEIIETKKASLVEHPPLSVQIKSMLPGVYLYKSGEFGEYRKISDMENLVNIGLDDKIEKIGIKNDNTSDFIAVLHDDPYGDGKLRIFFEERTREGWKINTQGKVEKTDVLAGNIPSEESTGKEFKPGEFRRISADDIDQYGKLNKASSIYIKEISSNISTCEEVRICTDKYGEGECLVYTPPGKEVELSEYIWIATSTLPIYIPQNIPEEIEGGKLRKLNGDKKSEPTKFGDNINSIEIKGNCLVVLFENKIDPERDTQCTGNPDKCWDKDTPGEHSEIFTKSDMDLTDNKIGKCGIIRGLGFILPKSCASAIAIYPIKK